MDNATFQLKPEALERFVSLPRGWPKTTQFRVFFRGVKGYHGQPERELASLKRGESVNHVIAKAFSEYLSERMGMIYTFDDLFESASAPLELGIWEDGSSVLDGLTEALSDRDEMYMHNPATDPFTMSEMIIRSLGRRVAKPGEALDAASCLRRGEAEIRRSVGKYAEWLRNLCKGHEFFRIAMFIVHKGERIGGSVVIPLKHQAFDGLCAGELDEKDITAADLDAASGCLYLHAMSDTQDAPGLTPRERSKAQAGNIFYQASYYTRSLRPYRPRLATVVVHQHHDSITTRMGFIRNGNFMKNKNYPIVLCEKTKYNDSTLQYYVSYNKIRFVLSLYRMANRSTWKKEDRAIRSR